jgi:hypothetical protein
MSELASSADDPRPIAGRLAELKAKYPPAEGPAADIDANLWRQWRDFKSAAAVNEHNALVLEVKIREAAGTANRLKVDGQVVARRVAKHVDNASWTSDYYMRVGKAGVPDERS